ncbi:hypothetical protein EDEG_00108 [Edhazardia aedis USNM 41457]|uniref:Uncharacterized protein n=1 Tax=Edhazardia aedis (strain USNM 41457) TaxID=1003232 RepID=J8ZYX8_EDHAE|nr:hypothetical protein EDEG_00108 [Edhazardia aedis USNM 41457]|eukprot:EJW04888.1 hypothetical protein EDEG_00108 [Edhazardia aedis USNM 41457]
MSNEVKWVKTEENGNIKRLYEYAKIDQIELYKCPNNICLIKLIDSDSRYVFLDVCKNKKIMKNRFFIEGNNKKIGLPFNFEIIEKANSSEEYICIIKILGK